MNCGLYTNLLARLNSAHSLFFFLLKIKPTKGIALSLVFLMF